MRCPNSIAFLLTWKYMCIQMYTMKYIKSLTTWITYSISFCHTEIIIFKQFLFLSVLLVYVVNANKLTFPFQIIKNKNMHCQFIFIRFFSSSVLSFILTQTEYKRSFHCIYISCSVSVKNKVYSIKIPNAFHFVFQFTIDAIPWFHTIRVNKINDFHHTNKLFSTVATHFLSSWTQ